MAQDRDLNVTVGVDGEDDVGRAADVALGAWRRAGETVSGAFRRAGAAITEELGAVARDSLRTLTALNALSFGKAIESAAQYRLESSRLAAAAGQGIGEIQGRLPAL